MTSDEMRYRLAKAMVQRQVQPEGMLSVTNDRGHRHKRHKRRQKMTVPEQEKAFRGDRIGREGRKGRRNYGDFYVPPQYGRKA